LWNQSASDQEVRVRKPKLLVGTADEHLRSLVFKALGERFNIEATDDGTHLLEMARSHHPALIIIDLFIRKLDGLQLCYILKSNGETKSIPIIAVSNLLAKDHALQAGANFFLSSPFKTKQLVEAVEKLTRL